jgi:hypothetical protein
MVPFVITSFWIDIWPLEERAFGTYAGKQLPQAATDVQLT